ncbi:transposase [Lactiplantibacillus plantarum]|nr:transposase [Lactiplantibacillus plantarum]MCG0694669.1 transposase [Lactiplantibacillus plantarum]
MFLRGDKYIIVPLKFYIKIRVNHTDNKQIPKNPDLDLKGAPQYFHSDMGSQYTSNEVETLVERHQISHSYSKQGYPYDNGPIEAFHSLLKREFAFQTTFSNFEDLVIRTSNYISWFNSDRIRTSV